jgi:hypothetical protein
MKFFGARTTSPEGAPPALKEHGFSRAEHTTNRMWALAPEGRISQRSFKLWWPLFASFTAILTIAPLAAQTTPPASAPPQAPPAQQSQQPAGKVIFSRSLDPNGQPTTPVAQSAPQNLADAPTAEDAERQAVTFTALDLDVHLRPADKHIAVRALLTVRNDGQQPLNRIPLQISSSLTWERIRLNQKDISFQVAVLNSDADHTGQLHEAVVPLAEPLAPGAGVELDVTYSGEVPSGAQRLLTIGTPDDAALHSDWDQIGSAFTGLRGFGNVVWYPVSSVPVILGDGARLFDEIGEHKLRLSGAHFRLRLTVEFAHEMAPTVAIINGQPAALTVTNPIDLNQEVSGVATADCGTQTLGFEAPSLFVAIRTAKPAANATLWVLPDDESAVQAWADAATAATPFLQGWLGQQPRSQLTLLDLPDSRDLPYETGSLLAAPIRAAAPDQLDGVLVHALTHAWMNSPRAWLSEGVASFMSSLWTEKQQGRHKALESLEAARPALALAEPPSPGESAGQPLPQAISPIYYRTKATYVFWMLRSMVGDEALSAALRAYDPAAALPPSYGLPQGYSQAKAASPASPSGSVSPSSYLEKLVHRTVEQAGLSNDLSWFFADWVNADKGLPDLSIASVYPTAEDAGNWLVTVNIANAGYAATEVPVTIRSNSSSITRRVLVPARGSVPMRLLLLGKPISVQVNDGTVPETQATVHVTRLDQASGSSTPPTSPPQQ